MTKFKFKFTSPVTLGAIVAVGAISVLGAPIGAPLMLGALGLVMLGRSGAGGVQAFNQEDAPFTPYAPELGYDDLSSIGHADYEKYAGHTNDNEELTQDDIITNNLDTKDKKIARDKKNKIRSELETEKDLPGSNDIHSSRKLLTDVPTDSPVNTLAPTPAPSLLPLPAYVVNNGASIGPNSFPDALAYVDSQGGNLTFGLGAHNQTCMLTSTMQITESVRMIV